MAFLKDQINQQKQVGWIASTQLNEMTLETIPANSNIPSPVSIAQETGMNGLPSSANGFPQRSNQSTETGRLQFNYTECVRVKYWYTRHAIWPWGVGTDLVTSQRLEGCVFYLCVVYRK
jgi:hypothetical protein